MLINCLDVELTILFMLDLKEIRIYNQVNRRAVHLTENKLKTAKNKVTLIINVLKGRHDIILQSQYNDSFKMYYDLLPTHCYGDPIPNDMKNNVVWHICITRFTSGNIAIDFFNHKEPFMDAYISINQLKEFLLHLYYNRVLLVI